ncbi:citrate/tricarballylate utilization protein [Colwellia chukchiensis]|uniref:Citrate/tricarballylate utilization protein n=1 Tax=Colwellia chukchiensis TaxID=641665 RepID=A0A1H7N7V7_9GAMM|nr:tricarballylate utilization 4Fe-4S protein TcuB [Colwellia chukchiensis]SEL19359.1 citrate/tricarballylate utilization protein [Colwellia chukchiensis]
MSVEKIAIVEIVDITNNNTPSTALVEAERIANICNACRYCEGFCAVFPAITQRRNFNEHDLEYLANLCHNCGACYHACQYAPPHEFSINLPQTLAELRAETYQKYAWPVKLGSLFHRNGLMVAIAVVLAMILLLSSLLLFQDRTPVFTQHLGAGAFYQVISHQAMVALAGTSFGFAIIALLVSFIKFCRANTITLAHIFSNNVLVKASYAAGTLKYLDGGNGQGCHTKDQSFSNTRRYFHHAMAWGFVLCFLATSVATLFEYSLDIMSPFPVISLPVILGSLGGLGLIVGPLGLIWLKIITDPKIISIKYLGMDYAFLLLLLCISITGFLLLGFRSTSAMGMLLIIHLGFVFALFLILPYSKFVHALYRFVALLKFYHEQAATKK